MPDSTQERKTESRQRRVERKTRRLRQARSQSVVTAWTAPAVIGRPTTERRQDRVSSERWLQG
jgi:hypothetical protein